MRIIAPMMILIMMTSTLAGCTGGDPDGGGNDEIDMDILNQLIDDNLQDFINNTTITVENHYHNNTTITNDNTDNSVSNINGTSTTTSTLHTLAGSQMGISNILSEDSSIALLVNNVQNDGYIYANFGLYQYNGISVCVEEGSVLESYADSGFLAEQSHYNPVYVDNFTNATSIFSDWGCGAIIGERSVLTSMMFDFSFDTWLTRNIAYSTGDDFQMNSYLELSIEQENGTSIFLKEIFASVKLMGTHPVKENITIIMNITDLVVSEYSFSQGLWGQIRPHSASSISGLSSCDHNLEHNFHGSGEMFAPGVECTHEITLSSGYDLDLLENQQGLDSDYDYSWGEWSYYIHWTSNPVETH